MDDSKNLVDFLNELDEANGPDGELRIVEIPMKDIIALNKSIEDANKKWNGYFHRSSVMAERYNAN